jgi:hypothetical protein
MGGHVAYMGDRRRAYRVLVGRPEVKRQFGGSRHRWEGNIKIYFQQMRCEGIDWINVAQDKDGCPALVIAVMNIKFIQTLVTSWQPLGFSGMTLLVDLFI